MVKCHGLTEHGFADPDEESACEKTGAIECCRLTCRVDSPEDGAGRDGPGWVDRFRQQGPGDLWGQRVPVEEGMSYREDDVGDEEADEGEVIVGIIAIQHFFLKTLQSHVGPEAFS
jgi:hypothetical protein